MDGPSCGNTDWTRMIVENENARIHTHPVPSRHTRIYPLPRADASTATFTTHTGFSGSHSGSPGQLSNGPLYLQRPSIAGIRAGTVDELNRLSWMNRHT